MVAKKEILSFEKIWRAAAMLQQFTATLHLDCHRHKENMQAWLLVAMYLVETRSPDSVAMILHDLCQRIYSERLLQRFSLIMLRSLSYKIPNETLLTTLQKQAHDLDLLGETSVYETASVLANALLMDRNVAMKVRDLQLQKQIALSVLFLSMVRHSFQETDVLRRIVCASGAENALCTGKSQNVLFVNVVWQCYERIGSFINDHVSCDGHRDFFKHPLHSKWCLPQKILLEIAIDFLQK